MKRLVNQSMIAVASVLLVGIIVACDVENGHRELRSVLESAKTKVTLSYSIKEGVLLNVITYTSL